MEAKHNAVQSIRTPRRYLLLFRVLALALVVIVSACNAGPKAVQADTQLNDLENIEELRIAFNQAAEKTRIILLLSPT